MTTSAIAAKVQILVDSADFPTITGDSAYDTWKKQPGNEAGTETDFLNAIRGPSGGLHEAFGVAGPGASVSSPPVYAATGLSASITPTAPASRIRIEVDGYASNTGSDNIIQFTLFRKIGAGSFVNLARSGETGFAAVRPINPDRVDSFTFAWRDEPNTALAVTYALYWMTHAGTARLGRRNSDTIMMLPTTMHLTELP